MSSRRRQWPVSGESTLLPAQPSRAASTPRPRGLVARWRHLTRAMGDTAMLLSHWPWLATVQTLRERFRQDHLGLTAGSLTFTTLMALVPLLTVMLAVFSAFPIFASFQQALEQYFLSNLVPRSIARPVMEALNSFASKANEIGAVGLLVLVATALALMLTIDHTLNAIWRVRRKRSFARRLLVYWAALTLGPLLLGVSLSITSYALSVSRGWVHASSTGVATMLTLMQGLLMLAAASSLYHFVPATYVRWRHALAGGLFVTLAIAIAKNGLTWYVSRIPTYSTLYGAFSAVPILFLWIYLMWVIVLLGAVIAAYAPTIGMRIARRASTPGHRFDLALALLARLAQARAKGHAGLAELHVARMLRADPLQVEPVLSALVDLGWVGVLDETGDPRYVLLVDPETTRAGPLVDALLLAPTTATTAFRSQAGIGSMTLGTLIGSGAAATG